MKTILLILVLSTFSFASIAQIDDLKDAADKGRELFNSNSLNIGQIKTKVAEFGANTVTELAIDNAFSADPSIYIPLPKQYEYVKTTVVRFGGESLVKRVEMQLNEAAEKTIDAAKPILTNAIQQLTLQDALSIAPKSNGFSNYLEGKSFNQIEILLRPLVKQVLDKAGTYNLLNDLFKQYKRFAGFFGKSIPNGPDLDQYVAEKATAGLFLKLGERESKFRSEKLPAIFN
ncbi:MAG: DUF4197 domain-containing protein [Luteibaculum sp.]